jgi:hypothetical protein
MTHLIPPRRGEVLSNKGIGTTRLMEYLERLTDTVNDSSDSVDAQIIQNLSSAVFALQVQVGSGDALTTDTDSFTTDDDRFTTDMTEA